MASLKGGKQARSATCGSRLNVGESGDGTVTYLIYSDTNKRLRGG